MTFIKKEDLEKQIKEEQDRLRKEYSQIETIDLDKVNIILNKGRKLKEMYKGGVSPFDPAFVKERDEEMNYFSSRQYCAHEIMKELNETERVYIYLCASAWDVCATTDIKECLMEINSLGGIPRPVDNYYPEFKDISKLKMEDLLRIALLCPVSNDILEKIFTEHEKTTQGGDRHAYALRNYPIYYTWMAKQLNHSFNKIGPHCREIRNRLANGELLDLSEFGRIEPEEKDNGW